MASRFVPAVDLLRSLGITEPEEIDIYAIRTINGRHCRGKASHGL